MSENLNLKQVAGEIGRHEETVREYLKAGIIAARKSRGDRGRWIITRESLNKYLNDHYDPRTGN